jgi:hypothetical protein
MWFQILLSEGREIGWTKFIAGLFILQEIWSLATTICRC